MPKLSQRGRKVPQDFLTGNCNRRAGFAQDFEMLGKGGLAMPLSEAIVSATISVSQVIPSA